MDTQEIATTDITLPVTFRSDKFFLRVTFPPEIHGYGEGVDGKQALYPPAKFSQNAFEATKRKQVELLRAHEGNTKNGGSHFWEEKQLDTRIINNAVTNNGFAEMPADGLTGSDLDTIGRLQKVTLQKSIPPTQRPKVMKDIDYLFDRFRISGIAKPTEQHAPKRVKVRISEILLVLEDHDILKEDSEG